MRIGELADEGGVSTKTIRYYESIGVMREPERTPSGYRDYGRVAVERLLFIRDAQATGLKLAERGAGLDPSGCTDPNRCQVIDAARHPQS